MAQHNHYALTPIAAAVLAAALLPTAPPAQAQDLALEEVIVTAQRRQTSLQDTPIAITAFSSEKLMDLGVFDLTDLGSRRQTPISRNSHRQTPICQFI